MLLEDMVLMQWLTERSSFDLYNPSQYPIKQSCRKIVRRSFRAHPINPVLIISYGFCCLPEFVKFFTLFCLASRIKRGDNPLFYTVSQKHKPNRSVRRVHVMPWATPVRRIGATRVDRYGREDDDPAGSLGRRL